MATPFAVSHQTDTRSVAALHLIAEFTARTTARLHRSAIHAMI
jgi:hypothetical protein